jgi:hypothetical protein
MGSYAFFYLAGMYPLPATKQYLLASPYFPQISFFNPLYNSTTTIKSINFTGNPVNGTGGNVFVKVRGHVLLILSDGVADILRTERESERESVQIELLFGVGCVHYGVYGRIGVDGRHQRYLWERGGGAAAFAVHGRIRLGSQKQASCSGKMVIMFIMVDGHCRE